MRVMKFRCYSPRYKEMIAPCYVEFFRDGSFLAGGDHKGTYNDDNMVIMQFSGLKDKNGKEIYEGDKDAFGNVVEWCNDGWCLNGDRPLSIFLNSFEVTGNIYEKP